jgi:cytochrome c biogenesis protein CcdA/thiol-disulfide isomerase/thioredoxin
MMVILVFFSILSGIATILSPCILPILPIVLSSSATTQRARPLGMITGLILSFSAFTLLITKIVSFLGLSANTLRLASVVILILVGLTMLIPALTVLYERLLGFLPGLVNQSGNRGSGFVPGFLTGATLGLVWAPCAGPILSAVIIVAATQTLSLNSALVVFSFAVGAGIPLLAVTYGGRALIQRTGFLSANLARIQRVFGVIVILTAVLIGFNLDTQISAWLTSVLPAGWTAGLNSFENSRIIQEQLAQLSGGGTVPPENREGAGILADLGAAPDFTGGTGWINSDALTLNDLKGKVVLVDFWTYSCINCIRTFPYLTDWYAKYEASGFVIIGVHAPEFAFEHDTANVVQAVKQFGIAYPVVQDNNYKIWSAYRNHYWPAEYLIDAQGRIRHYHFGEGSYDETEKDIQALLAEAGHPAADDLTQGPSVTFSSGVTPETYIGTARQSNFTSPEGVTAGAAALYSFPASLALHQFAVEGEWDFEPQYAQETEAGTRLMLHFFAQDVYLVMTSDRPATVRVVHLTPDLPNASEDVNDQGQIAVLESRLYHLVHFDRAMEGTIILEFQTPGVRAFSFTFGG